MYELIAASKGAASFDAGSVAEVSPLDGVHLDAEAHQLLGRAMAIAAVEALETA